MPRFAACTGVALLAALCAWPVSPVVTQLKQDSAASQFVANGQGTDSEWPAPYTYIRHSLDMSDDEIKAAVAALPFERIEVERVEEWGTKCKVTLWRDGRAQYEGNANAMREGTFEGTVSPFRFGRLCFLLEHDGFSALKSMYGMHGDDVPTCFLRVWRDGAAEPITVTDYGSGGPIQLWGMQIVVEASAERIEWKPVPKSK